MCELMSCALVEPNNTPPNIKPPNAPAILFAIPMMLILLAALSMDPNSVTYRLDAVCIRVKPAPCRNNPIKNIGKDLYMAAGININEPNIIKPNPINMPLINDILSNNNADGMANKKYDI